MEVPVAEATTTAQTNTEAATEAKADPSTMLGESAPESQKADAPKVEGDAKTEDAKTADAPAAPEKYEFKLPDGYTLDEEAFKVVEPALRDLNLTNESAQKLVEKYAEVQKIQSEAAEKAFNAQVEKWAEDVKADKELGGQAFEQSRTSAIKAVGKYGTPELKSLLNQTGLGNHPEFVRFCARIGKSLKEDDPINVTGKSSGEKSLEQRLWPNHQ